MFKTYEEIRDWLENFIPQVWGKEELGLLRIEELLKRLGDPQNKFKSIHIAGTSGKGSTAYYIARLLQYTDQRPEIRDQKVGLHVSPHLNYIGERMQINGEPIPEGQLIGLISRIRPIVEKIQKEKPELTPSYFEILVAMSFLYFAQEKVDWAVVEVGLGGRLDATNVLVPKVSVITNIGLDHTEILGDTVEKIATEKAGIVKRGIPVVTGATGKALRVIRDVAKKKNASIVSVLSSKYYVLSIEKYFTKETMALAIKTVEAVLTPNGSNPSKIQGYTLSREAIKQAFSVGFPGRFEEIIPGVILDGAHNPQKIKALINFLRKCRVQSAECKVVLVVAFKKGKDWKKMIDILFEEFSIYNSQFTIREVVATEFNAVTDTGQFAAVSAGEICDYVTKVHSAKCIVVSNSQEAVWEVMASNVKRKTSNGLIIVTGSLYLVGEVRTMWDLPEY